MSIQIYKQSSLNLSKTKESPFISFSPTFLKWTEHGAKRTILFGEFFFQVFPLVMTFLNEMLMKI